MHNISFPNIGINDMQVNRVAFTLFGREIYWYGIIIVSAIMLAIAYVFIRARKTEITEDNLYDLSIWLVVSGVLGARAYYVLTSLDKYDSFLDYFKIWEGGLGFYGGIIGGALAALIVCKIQKINFPLLADLVAPTLLLAQGIGRWGNFFNAEAYGSVTTWDFFGKTFNITGCEKLPWIMYINGTPVQPTFLYECVWNMIGFALLALLYKRRAFNGQIFLGYMCWYGPARMLIEGFRTDSLYVGTIRISQLVGLLSLVIGAALMIALLIMKKKGKLPSFLDKDKVMFPKAEEEEEPYESIFEKEEENGTDN